MDREIHTFFRSGTGYGLKKETADQILEDLKTIPAGEDLSPLIAQRGTAEYLFNLSDIRTNTAKFLNLTGRERVLEIGGGCGRSIGELHPEKVAWMDFRTRVRLPPPP